MELKKAEKIAENIKAQLVSYCERIEIGGSIRRQKPDVKDIEIICIPKTILINDGLFDTKKVRLTNFVNIVNQWLRIKGDAENGKYMQRLHPEAIKIDIFTTTPDNWGIIFAIRTGSAGFSHKVLANGWVKKGYHSVNGILEDANKKQYPIKEEMDLFNLIGIDYIEPKNRNL